MKGTTLIALALCLAVASATASGARWAVLIAGSNSYWNYRHQADICHAYQTLIQKGFPADHIITMAYDDIANDPSNPFPGKVFNRPGGKDVYTGCKIDYKGEDVTVANFLGVLTGNATATGGKRVLNSTIKDHVFINFADHGGTGLICVIDDYLYADQLLGALKTMHTKKMYQRLVFYMEACESGSMFQNLPANLSIYAATAANPDESSWGCYCPPDDVVNGQELNTCLGDTFSVVWMEDTDSHNVNNETLSQQFAQLLPLVNQSHPQQYGDLTWLNETLADYLGNKTASRTFRGGMPSGPSGQENARNAKLVHLKATYERNPTPENFNAYMKEIKSIQFFDHTFNHIDTVFSHPHGHLQARSVLLPENLSCLREAVASFERSCTKFTDYGLKYTKNIAHLCYTHSIADFDAFFSRICNQQELIALLA